MRNRHSFSIFFITCLMHTGMTKIKRLCVISLHKKKSLVFYAISDTSTHVFFRSTFPRYIDVLLAVAQEIKDCKDG